MSINFNPITQTLWQYTEHSQSKIADVKQLLIKLNITFARPNALQIDIVVTKEVAQALVVKYFNCSHFKKHPARKRKFFRLLQPIVDYKSKVILISYHLLGKAVGGHTSFGDLFTLCKSSGSPKTHFVFTPLILQKC